MRDVFVSGFIGDGRYRKCSCLVVQRPLWGSYTPQMMFPSCVMSNSSSVRSEPLAITALESLYAPHRISFTRMPPFGICGRQLSLLNQILEKLSLSLSLGRTLAESLIRGRHISAQSAVSRSQVLISSYIWSNLAISKVPSLGIILLISFFWSTEGRSLKPRYSSPRGT